MTICEVVSQLVSKCCESGSVESAIEDRFNRQCQTNAKALLLKVLLYKKKKKRMAGQVDTDLLEPFCLQETNKTKPFIYLLLKVVFPIYLLKDTLERTVQVRRIN